MKSGIAHKVYIASSVLANATHVKVEVFYSKGGMNYFNYKQEERGYWAAVRPVTLDNSSPHFSGESFMMFSDDRAFKVFLQGATRLSAKTLDALAVRVIAKANDVAKALEVGDKARVAALLKGEEVAAA